MSDNLKTRHKAGQSLSVELAEHFKQSGAPSLTYFKLINCELSEALNDAN